SKASVAFGPSGSRLSSWYLRPNSTRFGKSKRNRSLPRVGALDQRPHHEPTGGHTLYMCAHGSSEGLRSGIWVLGPEQCLEASRLAEGARRRASTCWTASGDPTVHGPPSRFSP